LKRGRDIARQARYAVFRHIRGNPDTRFAETYPYRYTLSTLPRRRYSCASEGLRGGKTDSGVSQTLTRWFSRRCARLWRAGCPSLGGIPYTTFSKENIFSAELNVSALSDSWNGAAWKITRASTSFAWLTSASMIGRREAMRHQTCASARLDAVI
jgi:hypothetical protein